MTRRARRGLATWITTSTTPIFVLDDRRVVLVFNQGCEELTRWPAEEVIGKACEFVTQTAPDQVESLTGALCPPQEVMQGVAGVVDAILRRPDGTSLERQIHFIPLPDGSGEGKLRVLGVILPQVPTETPRPQPRHFDLAKLTAELHRKYGVDRLVARSPEMKRTAAQVALARSGSASVHLTGQPGVGKEHVARMIHYGSPLKLKRFVPVRCDSGSHFELNRTIRRLFEESEGSALVGTVYLDQVHRLPRDLQSRLAERWEESHFRWMSSSVKGIDSLSAEEFDPELRCRLTSLTVELPPLRERGADLLLLAQQILEEGNREREKQHEGFSAAVERELLRYAWPGNVDELVAVVQQAARNCEAATIDVEHLPFQFTSGLDAQSIGPVGRRANLEDYLKQVEREQIEGALAQARGNKRLAADLLGIPRAKLYRRMEVLGIGEGEATKGQGDVT